MKSSRPIILIILDGWGYNENPKYNAIVQARTPFFDYLWKKYPHALLQASAEAVGLPPEQIGNSEIGHMTIGIGRKINTNLVRIDQAVAKNEFIANPAFSQLFNHVTTHNSTLHVMGLVSPGGIHSHRDHLYAFLKAAKSSGINKLAIHAFTDGRDVPPQSGAEYLRELEDVLDEIQIGFIATVSGRFYAMDRDKNWHRIEQAERAIFDCQGKICVAKKPSEVLKELYESDVMDELLEPLVFLDDDGQGWPIRSNDGVFFFNYRPDRARQLSSRIMARRSSDNLCFVTMTEYDKTLETIVAFPEQTIDDSLSALVSQAGFRQSHITETEKYAHLTYFFNGGHEEPHQNERHILVDSRKDIKTHDQAPEMRAHDIATKTIEQIKEGDDYIVINFANADMVGHTANVPAIKIAVETVDIELKRVVEATQDANGIAIITSDHGNAEINVDHKSGIKHTAHTLSPVPLIITNEDCSIRGSGTLADIAPTILKLMGLRQPSSMTGNILIK
ncbi:MAG: 2,3-bisphosphoglycerate-independent phosphoglycerate mutase [bacterium]|nr:2,3-bisphosphoglycerate-independent phosphoglycerate mutase [bacterium]